MIFFLTLFIAMRVFESSGQLPPLISSYGDDLICLPLILSAVVWVHRRREKNFTLPRVQGVMVLLFFSLYFEGILPLFSKRAVADPWDLLMYFAGWVTFEWLINESRAQSDFFLLPVVEQLPDGPDQSF